MALIDKINTTLLKLGSNVVLAVAPSPSGDTVAGETSGATAQTAAAPGVVVSEIIPQTIKISYSAIGAPVIQTDADGKEEHVLDGEYILTTNKKITIVDGKLTAEVDVTEMSPEEMMSGTTEMSMEDLEIALAEVELESNKKNITPDEQTALACKKKKLSADIEAKKACKTKLTIDIPVIELAKYPWDKCMADMSAQGYSKDAASKICGSIKAKGTTMAEDQLLLSEEQLKELLMAANIERQRLADIVDLSKNGSYCINLEVRDGAITYGSMQTNTYQDLMLAKETEIETKVTELTEAFEAKIKGLEKIAEALKSGETKITPLVASDAKLSKADYLKFAIQEKINNNKL